MTNIMNRRAVMAGTMALAGTSRPAVALATSHPDNEIFAQIEAIRASRAEMNRYGDLHTQAEDALIHLQRAMPQDESAIAAAVEAVRLADVPWTNAVDARSNAFIALMACPAMTLQGLAAKVTLVDSEPLMADVLETERECLEGLLADIRNLARKA